MTELAAREETIYTTWLHTPWQERVLRTLNEAYDN